MRSKKELRLVAGIFFLNEFIPQLNLEAFIIRNSSIILFYGFFFRFYVLLSNFIKKTGKFCVRFIHTSNLKVTNSTYFALTWIK